MDISLSRPPLQQICETKADHAPEWVGSSFLWLVNRASVPAASLSPCERNRNIAIPVPENELQVMPEKKQWTYILTSAVSLSRLSLSHPVLTAISLKIAEKGHSQ